MTDCTWNRKCTDEPKDILSNQKPRKPRTLHVQVECFKNQLEVTSFESQQDEY